MEPTVTIRPAPARRIPGRTSWTSRTGPKTLVSKIPRTRSIGSVSIAPISWMPALLTSPPIAPRAIRQRPDPAARVVALFVADPADRALGRFDGLHRGAHRLLAVDVERER